MTAVSFVEAVQWCHYVGIIGNNPLVDVTHTQKRAKLCESAWAPHIMEALGVCLRHAKPVRRDVMAMVFQFGCKPVAFIQLQRYSDCIVC